MIIINETKHSLNINSQILSSYFNDYNYGFLDIETTGLSSSKNKIILVGLFSKTGFYQFFAEERKEEVDILNELVSILKDIDILITFNGTSFDIPFLNQRFEFHNIDYKIPSASSFDLYLIFKKYSTHFNLPNYKLKTIEKLAGIQREDLISGKESVELFNKYERSRAPDIKDIILLHNKEDILNMPILLDVFKRFDIHSIMYSYLNIVPTSSNQVYITKKKLLKNSLQIIGKLKKPINSISIYEDSYSFNYSAELNSFDLKINLLNENDILFLKSQSLNFEYIIKTSPMDAPENIIVFSINGKSNYAELNNFIKTILYYIIKSYSI